jgi:hypothetical protein
MHLPLRPERSKTRNSVQLKSIKTIDLAVQAAVLFCVATGLDIGAANGIKSLTSLIPTSQSLRMRFVGGRRTHTLRRFARDGHFTNSKYRYRYIVRLKISV